MKNFRNVFAALLVLLGFCRGALAFDIVENEKFDFKIKTHMQMIGLAQRVPDPVKDNNRLYLFLKQARVHFLGRVEDIKYNVGLAFAGEEEVRAPSPGVSLNLLDLYFDFPILEVFNIRAGQFKIPYGRERLTGPGSLQFADTSIQDVGFKMGRDIGLAVHAQLGKLAGAGGVFAGGGRDVPQRFLPEDLGFPLVVFRTGWNDGVDEDLFDTKQSDFESDRLKKAFFVNGFYMKDSLIGHSTVLNVKLSDKSLLINNNWNPFIQRSPLSKGNLWQVGGDAAIRAPLGAYHLSGEAELNYGRYSNTYGNIGLFGGRIQGGIFRKPFEAALRYAFLLPHERFLNGGVQITGDQPIHEITPALTWHVKKDRMKIILDAPIMVDVPVFIESGVGSYVSLEQPDQATVIRTGSVSRQTVLEGRLLFQLAL